MKSVRPPCQARNPWKPCWRNTSPFWRQLFLAGKSVAAASGPATDSLLFHKKPEPRDEALLDRTAMMTHATVEEVYAVRPEEVPDGAPLVAIFRY